MPSMVILPGCVYHLTIRLLFRFHTRKVTGRLITHISILVASHPSISFGIHFDPLISWFSTYSYDTRNDGVVPGFNFGISYNRYFSPNYSFSSGINIINAGGRLISREITHFELKNYNHDILTVQPGEAITYRITYLSVPLGLKLQTNRIGYGRFFTDIGFDPKIVIGGRADIPSLNIKGGNAYAGTESIQPFISYNGGYGISSRRK